MNEERHGQVGHGHQGGRGGGSGGGGRSGGHHFRHRYGGHKGGQQNHQRGDNRQQPRRSQPPHVPSETEKLFMSKTPIDPCQWIKLENGSNDLSMRAMDLLCPIGRGTRGLIVAPPKAGKTTFLKQISNAVAAADPKIKQYCLLIDERPEEVTDFKRSVPAEVFASSSDQAYERHVATAEGMMRSAVEHA